MGSPPQVRGKPAALNRISLSPGITPAGAGKTVGLLEDLAGAEDHPRRCGENRFKVRKADNDVGSPPQVRGKLPVGAVQPHQPGITPAGAGKTSICRHAAAIAKDHPRRCGENVD